MAHKAIEKQIMAIATVKRISFIFYNLLFNKTKIYHYFLSKLNIRYIKIKVMVTICIISPCVRLENIDWL